MRRLRQTQPRTRLNRRPWSRPNPWSWRPDLVISGLEATGPGVEDGSGLAVTGDILRIRVRSGSVAIGAEVRTVIIASTDTGGKTSEDNIQRRTVTVRLCFFMQLDHE